MLYIIENNTPTPYNGEAIRISIGNRLVKQIFNPTEEQQRMVGYTDVVRAEIPEYNAETEYVETSYVLTDGKYIETHTVKGIYDNETA